MTKRKRTPSSSPPPRARVPVQISASLQRLSILSRSLAYQSDKLTTADQDAHNMQAQAQASDTAPLQGTARPAGIPSANGQKQGFRGFAPPKQPSFPETQTWVAPKGRPVPTPDPAGFMPRSQPSFPQGQAWPQPQPRYTAPVPANWAPRPSQRSAVPPTPNWGPSQPRYGGPPPPNLFQPQSRNAEPPPPDSTQPQSQHTGLTPPNEAPSPVAPQTPSKIVGRSVEKEEAPCLETQPQLVAALIAQKRAAAAETRKRAAWARMDSSQARHSPAPDDQLRNELNQTLESRPYVTPTTAITFDPVSSSAEPDPTTNRASAASQSSQKPPRASYDMDSLFASSGSTSPAPNESSKTAKDFHVPQLPTPTSTTTPAPAPFASPTHISYPYKDHAQPPGNRETPGSNSHRTSQSVSRSAGPVLRNLVT